MSSSPTLPPTLLASTSALSWQGLYTQAYELDPNEPDPDHGDRHKVDHPSSDELVEENDDDEVLSRCSVEIPNPQDRDFIVKNERP